MVLAGHTPLPRITQTCMTAPMRQRRWAERQNLVATVVLSCARSLRKGNLLGGACSGILLGLDQPWFRAYSGLQGVSAM